MNIVALFILAASLLATIWAGKVELLPAAVILFGAAAISDLVGAVSLWVTKTIQTRNMEALLNGMAQGISPQGLQDQIRNAARKAGQQIDKGPH